MITKAKRIVIVCLTLAFLACAGNAETRRVIDDGSGERVYGQYLLTAASVDVTAEQIEEICQIAELPLASVEIFRSDLRVFFLNFDPDPGPETIEEKLLPEVLIDAVQPNYIRQTRTRTF